MTARFYAPGLAAPGDRVELPADESTHLTRVLRLGAGAEVRVFNGRGHEFSAVVERASKTLVVLRALTEIPAVREPRTSVTLAQAVLKGDKMDDVVRDAVMLGAASIQPLVTTRSEVSVAALERGRRTERWSRVAVSSAKQCGRAVVPAVHPPQTLAAFLEELDAAIALIVLAEPSAAASPTPLSGIAPAPQASVALLVGPEGGWTSDELRLAAQRGQVVTLGARTLRADATPLVALTALFAWWGEL